MTLTYALVSLLAGIIVWGAILWIRAREPETDPIKLRVKQAAELEWKQTAQVTEDGFGAAWTQRSIRYARGNEEAVLWLKDATVTLVRDHAPLPLDDFIELEEWIRKNPRNPDDDAASGELRYLREIERFVKRHGHFEPLLEAQATDKAFFMAIYGLHKSGFATHEEPQVVAALTLDALQRFNKDRSDGLLFLKSMEDIFKRKPPMRNGKSQ